jgi:hypothetical protein
MNAHCERFNRTVQEQFVDWHEDLLFTDLKLFNQKLAQWLIDYNTVLPHHSLDLKAPVQWLMENHKECQRYWTNTIRKAVSEWLAHQSQPQWPEIVVNFQGMADRREPRPTETARRGSTGMR